MDTSSSVKTLSLSEAMEKFHYLADSHRIQLPGKRIHHLDEVSSIYHNISYLNLADNYIHKLEGLGQFISLRTLNLSNNDLEHKKDVAEIFELKELEELDLSRNPISHLNTYRLLMVNKIPSLEVLDNQSITPEERLFAQNFIKKQKTLTNLILANEQTTAKLESLVSKLEVHKEMICNHQVETYSQVNVTALLNMLTLDWPGKIKSDIKSWVYSKLNEVWNELPEDSAEWENTWNECLESQNEKNNHLRHICEILSSECMAKFNGTTTYKDENDDLTTSEKTFFSIKVTKEDGLKEEEFLKNPFYLPLNIKNLDDTMNSDASAIQTAIKEGLATVTDRFQKYNLLNKAFKVFKSMLSKKHCLVKKHKTNKKYLQKLFCAWKRYSYLSKTAKEMQSNYIAFWVYACFVSLKNNADQQFNIRQFEYKRDLKLMHNGFQSLMFYQIVKSHKDQYNNIALVEFSKKLVQKSLRGWRDLAQTKVYERNRIRQAETLYWFGLQRKAFYAMLQGNSECSIFTLEDDFEISKDSWKSTFGSKFPSKSVITYKKEKLLETNLKFFEKKKQQNELNKVWMRWMGAWIKNIQVKMKQKKFLKEKAKKLRVFKLQQVKRNVLEVWCKSTQKLISLRNTLNVRIKFAGMVKRKAFCEWKKLNQTTRSKYLTESEVRIGRRLKELELSVKKAKNSSPLDSTHSNYLNSYLSTYKSKYKDPYNTQEFEPFGEFPSKTKKNNDFYKEICKKLEKTQKLMKSQHKEYRDQLRNVQDHVSEISHQLEASRLENSFLKDEFKRKDFNSSSVSPIRSGTAMAQRSQTPLALNDLRCSRSYIRDNLTNLKLEKELLRDEIVNREKQLDQKVPVRESRGEELIEEINLRLNMLETRLRAKHRNYYVYK